MSETAKKIIPGKTFTLAGEDYVVAALSARATKLVQDKTLDSFLRLQKIQGQLTAAQASFERGEIPEDQEATIKQLADWSREAVSLDFETNCLTAYEAFRRNNPEISMDDFLDLATAAQVREIAAWALLGDDSAKKS